MKRTTLLTLALACGAVFAAPKADLAKGKQIAQTVCAACHAADGNSGISSYPKLSTQHAAYTIKETVAIKDGKRTTGGAAAMRPMVGSLSAQDIADVAAFYATQTPKPGEANPKDNLDLGAKIFRAGREKTACLHGLPRPKRRGHAGQRHRCFRLSAFRRPAQRLHHDTAESLCFRPAQKSQQHDGRRS